MSINNSQSRPYNSIRFICRCGRKQTFPVSPPGGRKATADYTLKDGTRKVVSSHYKEVYCVCGLNTFKERRNFNGEIPTS